MMLELVSRASTELYTQDGWSLACLKSRKTAVCRFLDILQKLNACSGLQLIFTSCYENKRPQMSLSEARSHLTRCRRVPMRYFRADTQPNRSTRFP